MNFKTYLKILKNGSNILGFQTNFCSTKIKKQFSKTILKNYFSKLFFFFKLPNRLLINIYIYMIYLSLMFE